MAMRDHVIYNQRETLRNMWSLLKDLGFDEKQISDLAAKRGIKMQDRMVEPDSGLSDMKQSLNFGYANLLKHHGLVGQSYRGSSCTFSNYQCFGLQSLSNRQWDMGHSLIREEHHSSYSLLRHDNSPNGSFSYHWAFNRPAPWFPTDDKLPSHLQISRPEIGIHTFPFSEGPLLSSEFRQQNKVW